MLIALASACEDPVPPRPPQPDLEPPAVVIDSSNTWDSDGDGLVELRLSWSDETSPIAHEAVSVSSLDGIASESGVTDLLDRWTVERIDSAGLVLRETIGAALPAGSVRLELKVPDTAGNVWSDTVVMQLPALSLHREIDLEVRAIPFDMVHCSDDRRFYLSLGDQVVVLDDTAHVMARPAWPTMLGIDELACVPGHPLMPLAGPQDYLNRTTFERIRDVREYALSTSAVAGSKVSSDIIYVGEDVGSGDVMKLSHGTIEILDRIELPPPASGHGHVNAIVVVGSDEKLYVARYTESGIRVIDLATDSTIAHIDISLWTDHRGVSDDMVLSPDESLLYVGGNVAEPPGVAVIDTELDSVIQFYELQDIGERVTKLALSPSGRFLFVAAAVPEPSQPGRSYLFDTRDGTLIQTFPYDAPGNPGDYYPGPAAFNLSGRIMLWARFEEPRTVLSTYISRERTY